MRTKVSTWQKASTLALSDQAVLWLFNIKPKPQSPSDLRSRWLERSPGSRYLGAGSLVDEVEHKVGNIPVTKEFITFRYQHTSQSVLNMNKRGSIHTLLSHHSFWEDFPMHCCCSCFLKNQTNNNSNLSDWYSVATWNETLSSRLLLFGISASMQLHSAHSLPHKVIQCPLQTLSILWPLSMLCHHHWAVPVLVDFGCNPVCTHHPSLLLQSLMILLFIYFLILRGKISHFLPRRSQSSLRQ